MLCLTPNYATTGNNARIDYNAFTFATNASFLTDTSATFGNNQLNSLPIPWNLNFSGVTNIVEVRVHINSLDQIRIEALAPALAAAGIGFEVLSFNVNANSTGTGGNLSFGVTNSSTGDGSLDEEAQDGAGGGSGDGTIRFFSLTGAPITNVPLLLVAEVPRGVSNDRFQYAVEVGFDTDGDGLSDSCDFDSDNDGVSDVIESGDANTLAADTNLDGTVSVAEAAAAGLVDANGDGVWDTLGNPPVDSDGDGINDYLDLDSENDGIPDAIEAQPTIGYQTPSIGADAGGDGVVDTFDDGTTDHGGNFN